MQSKYNIKSKGSFTVEISLIMPLILSIIIMIIYLGMYIYDASLAEYSAVAALLQENYGRNDRNLTEAEDSYYESVEVKMQNRVCSYLTSSLSVISSDIETSASHDFLSINMNIKAIRWNLLMQVFSAPGYRVTYNVNNVNEYEYLIK